MKRLSAILMFVTFILTINVFTVPMHTYAMAPYSYSPLDIEVEFKVYPDGTVELAADYFYNYTFQYAYSTAPNIHSEVEILKEDEFTTVNTHETVKFSDEEASQFPLNSTEISISEGYSEGILNTKISGYTIFPDRWCGYPPYSSSYTCIDFNSFPFNSTDLTIYGRYSDGEYNGSLIIHFVPGVTLGDIELNVKGNTTHLLISDSVIVFYNYKLPLYGFPPLNRTIVEEISQNKTYIDQMLYEMTGGLVTCEVYDVTIVQIDENSDRLDIEIVLQGDFIEILAKMYESIIMQVFYSGYYYVPPEQMKIIRNVSRDLANITSKCAGEGNFELSYTSSARRVDFTINFSANLDEIWNMTDQMIVDDFTPEIQPYIKKFLEMKYASAKSYTETFIYSNGQMEHTGSYVFQGSISEELNLAKELYIGLLVETSPYPQPWQINFINETRIVGMNDFRFIFDETFEEHSQIVSFSFQGIRVAPPIDSINATHFKLTRFFNLTYDPYSEPPESNQRLKIIVKGESNGTHMVVPIVDPEKVPVPDEILSGNTLVWNNQSISGLRELVFRVYSGFAQYVDKDYISPNKPYQIDAKSFANCEVIINRIEKDSLIIIKNVTLPEGISPPGTYKVLGNYVQIMTETGEEINGNFTIKMYYDQEKLAELGIDESSLKIYYWDSNKNEWIPVKTYLNSEEHYVWASVDHLSIWAVMGQTAKPIWTEIQFLAMISGIIVALILIAVFLTRKHKKEEQI